MPTEFKCQSPTLGVCKDDPNYRYFFKSIKASRNLLTAVFIALFMLCFSVTANAATKEPFGFTTPLAKSIGKVSTKEICYQ